MMSSNAAISDWVRFEYQEAAAIFGRVIFLFHQSPAGNVQFEPRSKFTTPTLAALNVKHSAMLDHTPDDALLIELCNDPDEGWFDDTETYQPQTERDLKTESEIRKFVRSCLMFDPRYAGKTIVDSVAVLVE